MSTYKEIPWLSFRNDLKDFLDLTKGRNFIHAITEVDITKASQLFEERKKTGLPSYSVTAYIIWCYGQAIKQHPEIQGLRNGKKIILFDDVDVATMIEKDLPGGRTAPLAYIFRSVQSKSFADVNKEMQDAKTLDIPSLKKRKKSLIIKSLPKFLRMFILRQMLKNPFRTKEVLGTVGLTSLGMVLTNRRFWPVPMGPYPLTIAIGATHTDGDKKILCLTVVVDHDLSDGAPVARFGNTLLALIESGAGIN